MDWVFRILLYVLFLALHLTAIYNKIQSSDHKIRQCLFKEDIFHCKDATGRTLETCDKTSEIYVITNLVFFDRSINFVSWFYIISTGTIEKWIFFFVMYDELKMFNKYVDIKCNTHGECLESHSLGMLIYKGFHSQMFLK